MPNVGDPAPNFSLPDQEGNTHTLSNYRGRWVVLYFYPKDDTPGCTKEACNFRDEKGRLEELGAVVFGVSADPVESHRKFHGKYGLNFPLLSDPDQKTIRAYGAWGLKRFMGKEYEGVLRQTFLIDPEGRVAKIWETVRPDEHALEVADALVELKKQAV
ncbi:MAG: thioredoxin-dependent thiol peroxidase [Meiothermus sp.]|uniref:thioredoxin-dependent thiol peroxidase n=1 Tax=Meiothermus sp. TaxID=1955249 RepID=UPI0025E52CC9|nr:thioredoxin-dependent thiol peroxidase [Meiothermus sp.]MCS7067377.1 thioredoxin-dependent thiol peroxidase [Meiothermus sp.]MCX7600455.1 thioredoxin-dependent thiol peroxidase [Meiothermus sp.]MDW8424664.1 thioredoxin-dependent thiol peroxidase [Meiothermus sp.]